MQGTRPGNEGKSVKRAWIPNLLTFGNLTCGFVSIVFSGSESGDRYFAAAVLVLAAALLDGMDGQVARWLKTESTLGKELDSLADCVTFGVAPGYLAYRAYLSGMHVWVGRVGFDAGILIAAVFPICAAYRLARFNVRSSSGSFSGLPSPAAALLVVLGVIVFLNTGLHQAIFAILFCIVGFLMVSTITYSKPQATVFRSLRGLKLVLLIILVVLLLVFFRFGIALLFFALYATSGLIGFVIHFIEHRRY
jgi:CDP-diacylglycerol---serine O-phosphatidyltransferase